MTVDQDTTETTTLSTGSSAAPSGAAKSGTTFESLAVAGFIFGLFAVAVAVFAVALAGRAVSEAGNSSGGSGTKATSGGAAITKVALGDFYIKPKDAVVKAGTVLDLTNEGAVDHNLAIEGGKASDMLAPGAEGKLDTAGLKPGTYTWICEVPGHEAAGMTGTVTVE